MTEEQNVFDQPGTNNLRTYDNIQKNVTGQGDDCTAGCLLNYNYIDKHYKMISTDLSKQQSLNTRCLSKSKAAN